MTAVQELLHLLILAIPVACVAWTVTHEEVFREPREYCAERCRREPRLLRRKLFYILTCEYCFSHYVALFFAAIARYRLLFDDWRGFVIGFFALVWIANVYMSAFGRLRLGIRSEHLEIEAERRELEESSK
jgi:hypothetical protein